MTKKQYININGIWHRVYANNDWYDWLCWAVALAMLATIGFAALTEGVVC